MTKQAKQTDTQAQPIERTGFRWQAWLVFFIIVAASLAADLGLKYWSFGVHEWAFTQLEEKSTVRAQAGENGEPQVIMPIGEAGSWVVVSTVGPNGEPPQVPIHEPVVVIPGLLNLQLTLNTGAVFGTGQGGRPFFIVISIIAVFVILFLLYRSPANTWFYQAGLALILGGAIGNLYDRFFYSAVRDMLHMLPSTGLWPWIFNPADVALVCGVALVLLVSWLSEWKQKKQKKLS